MDERSTTADGSAPTRTVRRPGFAVGAALAAGALLGGVAISSLSGGGPTPALAQSESGGASSRFISVQGQAEVEASPDTAMLQIGVRADGDTAQAALATANERANKLMTALEQQGIDEKDITTSELSIQPRYDREGIEIVGYTASNGVSVKIRDIEKAGPLIDAAAGLVGDGITIGGISFFIEDTAALESQGRADAIADARSRAEDYAEAAGVELAGVRRISETPVGVIPVAQYSGDAAAEAADGGAPINPGTSTITLTVTVQYQLGS